MSLSEHLKEIREGKGMNKAQFADFLSVPYTTYIGYESGNRKPKMSVLNEFSEKLNVTIEYLLSNEARQPENEKKIQTYADIIDMLFQIEDSGILYELIQHSSFDEVPEYVPIEIKDEAIKLFIMQWCRMKYVLQQNMIDTTGYDAWKMGILQKYSEIPIDTPAE